MEANQNFIKCKCNPVAQDQFYYLPFSPKGYGFSGPIGSMEANQNFMLSWVMNTKHDNISCSHALRCSHTPIQKKHKKVLEKINQKYEWIDDENIHLHAKFYKERKKKIRMQLMSTADWGKECTRHNYIIGFSFFVSLGRIFHSSLIFAWRLLSMHQAK